MSTRPPSRVVFVGNIPYTKTEEQIIDLFSSVGRVLNFRLVYDRENGRPKGFGFAEFADPDTAASAVRNLNNMEIDGRKLRVDFSNETATDEDDRDGTNRGNANNTGANGIANSVPAPGPGSSALPPLPPGRELPPGVSCTDAISQTLQTLPPTQLLDFIRAMKEMALNDTDRCIELLNQAPQLGYAVFQAMLLMGLVSPDVINSVLDPNSALPRPQLYVPGAQQLPVPPPAAAAAPYGYAPPATATPPVVGGYVLPTAAAPAPVAAAPAAMPDTEQLMRAVMELSDEQIEQLPPAEREQIKTLRATFGRR